MTRDDWIKRAACYYESVTDMDADVAAQAAVALHDGFDDQSRPSIPEDAATEEMESWAGSEG